MKTNNAISYTGLAPNTFKNEVSFAYGQDKCSMLKFWHQMLISTRTGKQHALAIPLRNCTGQWEQWLNNQQYQQAQKKIDEKYKK